MPKPSEISSAPVSMREKRPKSKDDIISFVDDAWGYLSHNRFALEQQIKEAIHFYAGDQWVRYLPHARRYVKHGLDEWVPTPVTNLIIEHTEAMHVIDVNSGNSGTNPLALTFIETLKN